MTIVDSEMKLAGEALIGRVQGYIDEQRFIGADVTVKTASERIINISCKLIAERDVMEELENNLEEYLRSVSFKGSYISYAKTGNVIFETDGVIDYVDLKINGDTVNIPINETEIAVLGGVNIDGD